jgi:hypothetical protein
MLRQMLQTMLANRVKRNDRDKTNQAGQCAGHQNRGLAYDPTTNFARYKDGTVNHWEKMERPTVYLENGHVAYFTFAVIDVPKENEHGNDNHGSKVVVDPFDGVKFDRDMQRSAKAEERKSK